MKDESSTNGILPVHLSVTNVHDFCIYRTTSGACTLKYMHMTGEYAMSWEFSTPGIPDDYLKGMKWSL